MQQSEDSSSKKILLIGFLIFLGLGFLVGAYIWAHNPVTSSVFIAVGQTMLNILVWLVVIWLTTVLGMMILTALKLQADDGLGELAIAAGLGLGFLAILVSLLGFAGGFNSVASWAVIILLSIITLRQWRPLSIKLISNLQIPHPQNNLQGFIFIFAIITLSYSFIMALTPTVAWDSLAYHLVGPKIYIELGTFAHPLNIPQLGFPLLGQMLFTFGMLLVGDGTAALFHFGFGLLTIALVIVLTRCAFSQGVAWLTVLVLLSVPMFLTLTSWPYVDVILMYYTTAVFFAFYQWWQTRKTAWLVVLGIMIGLSGGLKYTAIATPVAVTIGIVIVSRRDGLLTIAKRLLLVAIIALLLILPWLLENYNTTGNPVYPFFITDAKFWDEWRAWWYNRPGTGLLSTSPLSLLLAPLEASILDGTLGGGAYDGTIGPLVLGIILFLPFVWNRLTPKGKQVTGFLLLFAGSTYLFWLWGIAQSALLLQTRLLLPAFGLFAMIAGIVLFYLQKFKHPQLAVDWLVRILLILLLIIMLVSHTLVFLEVNPLPVLVGLESKEAYLDRQLGTYMEVITAVNQLPPDSNVQFLWEARSYHCEVTCQPDPILDTWLHLTQYNDYNVSEIADLWQEKGITHVLMFDAGFNFIIEAEFDPVTDNDVKQWKTFSETYLQPLEVWPEQYTLYKFSP